MSNSEKLVIFELNEVPFRVFDHFIKHRPNSNFARLFSRSDVFETFTEDEGHLSPWITWPTLHRGVTNRHHGIVDFGQDLTEVDAEFPPVWQILAKAGIKPGIFGSLHTYPLPADFNHYSFYMPDTFAAGPECFPEKLSDFQAFNLAMVDASGRNVNRGLMLSKALPFLKAAPGLGLRGKTIASLSKQLVLERVSPLLSCRRRTSQVEIAFDFYLKQLQMNKPNISFFFSNHVASSLHRYWPGTFPDDYEKHLWANGYDKDFSGEIFYTMAVADNMIGDLAKFVERNDNHRLIVMTSMGQQAVPDANQVLTQLYCVDLAKLMTCLGIPNNSWDRRRAMLPTYTVGIKPEFHDQLIAKLQTMTINGKQVRFNDHGESVMIVFGHENLEGEIKLSLENKSLKLSDAGLRNVEIQDKSATFAYHIPQGVLMSYAPAKSRGLSQKRRRISTLEIAPAILSNFGLDTPSYMQSGFSLS